MKTELQLQAEIQILQHQISEHDAVNSEERDYWIKELESLPTDPESMQRQIPLMRGFLTNVLREAKDPLTKAIALRTVRQLHEAGVPDLDALLAELGPLEGEE